MKVTGKILQILKGNMDKFVSGEQLGIKFKISRTAIWKSIQRLRAKGYRITAHKKEGYKLISVPDFLLPQEIQDGLKTKFIGKNIYYFRKIPSTNEHAKKLAMKGIEEGTVVIAERQTRGKGRLGRHWASPAGGIWLSVILRPKFTPQDAPIITMAATLAVARAIEEVTEINAKIKWPNDVVIEVKKKSQTKKPQVKKVCGILTEMAAEIARINYVIVGIGINVNNKIPRDLRSIACGLNEQQYDINRSLLAKRLLEKLEYYYCLMLEKRSAHIIKECRKLSVILGEMVKVRFPDRIITGRAININDKGSLILKLKNNTRQEIIAGDISLRR